MSRRPRAAVASAAIAALLLSGCASNGTSRQPTAQVTALADGRTPFAAAAEPADVLGQRHESDSPDYTLRFPEVRGAEAFNRKISDFVSELRRQRLPEFESSGAGGKKPVPGEYELDWQVTQNCRSHVSFLLHDRSTLPGAGPITPRCSTVMPEPRFRQPSCSPRQGSENSPPTCLRPCSARATGPAPMTPRT